MEKGKGNGSLVSDYGVIAVSFDLSPFRFWSRDLRGAEVDAGQEPEVTERVEEVEGKADFRNEHEVPVL